MKILVNYADKSFYESQKLNSNTGLEIGNFDKCISYKRNSIDKDFLKKHKDILNIEKGAGLWLWKPYIILETLNNSNEDDIIFYCDSGSIFIKSMNPIFELIKEHNIVVFDVPKEEAGYKEAEYTKKQTFINMDCFYQDYLLSNQREGGFVGVLNNEKSRKFVSDWLSYCCIPENINDECKDELEIFKEHRHDQSILSLLSKKWNIKAFEDLTQWGEHKKRNYETLIYLTRNRK